MNGKSPTRLLLDTNAVVALLRGHPEVKRLCSKASWLGISIITELEFLAFPSLTAHDRTLFAALLRQITVVGLVHEDKALLQQISQVRQTQKLKLPDAIILASARHNEAYVLTADKHLAKYPEVTMFDAALTASEP